ncbi:MAG: 1,4-alpha-glucan branching protein GlgB [Lachnospiraceae bacterium]|jgi:1,4-alpha-glucan branching enzyme|nr:1,4-alpha-glucan branching protein GlgB [Lachnospiraceae bacterium]
MHRDKVFISKDDRYLFGRGTHYEIYRKLGAHLSQEKDAEGVFFAVWAPNAQAVSVVGSFNDWEPTAHPMYKLGEEGIWSLFVPLIGEGEMYKYWITTQDGRYLYKADPYANFAEVRPGTASVVTDLSGFLWQDQKWVQRRAKSDPKREPMAIYECHIGSFMKHPDGTEDGFYTYCDFAERIIPYLKSMGYTHIELMGIAEHPYDGSWGYQVTGYYAPTSRYGSPKEFMSLINELHKAGIGVILDWVPAHFATDAHGLAKFDGQCIFEHPDPRLGEHPDWGTKIFNYGKTEVQNFLIANILYWAEAFHIDGIRADAVASMLYLDYGKKEGQWLPNRFGDNENLEAIEFFRHLNTVVKGIYPGFLTIAEESTAWPAVTGELDDPKALGFSFKWNMGWMHDFCEYMKLDPYFRKGSHWSMTFAMSYNESENYILPLSHDEVVHLKCSMLNKMPGLEGDKFANLRVGYTFMFGHSGKKLLFMGQDFGQKREWSEARELDWFLLKEAAHAQMHDYVKELLHIYRKHPCLYEEDNNWSGFEWMNADDKERSTFAFVRKNTADTAGLLFVLNMTPMLWKEYQVGVPNKKKYKLILNSDHERFGGNGIVVPEILTAQAEPYHYQKYSITFDLPPFGGLIFSY